MTLINTKIIPFNSLPGMVIDYGKVGVVLGVYIQNYQAVGILIEDVPEVDTLQAERCPNCKALEHIKNCFREQDAKKQFNDYGYEI